MRMTRRPYRSGPDNVLPASAAQAVAAYQLTAGRARPRSCWPRSAVVRSGCCCRVGDRSPSALAGPARSWAGGRSPSALPPSPWPWPRAGRGPRGVRRGILLGGYHFDLNPRRPARTPSPAGPAALPRTATAAEQGAGHAGADRRRGQRGPRPGQTRRRWRKSPQCWPTKATRLGRRAVTSSSGSGQRRNWPSRARRHPGPSARDRPGRPG